MANSSGHNSSRKSLSKKELRQKRKMERTIGMALTAVLLIAMLIFMGLLLYLDILPTIYVVAIIVVFVLLLCYVLLSQFTKAHMIGKVLAVILSIVMAIGSYYLAVTNSTLGNLDDPDENVDIMSIIVMADDKAESINDTGEYTYGIDGSASQSLTQETLDLIKSELKVSVSTTNYENWNEQIAALYSGEVQAIIFNESNRSNVNAYGPEYDFDNNTRVLDYKKIENDIKIEVPEKEIADESFTVFLSGMDSEGKLGAKGHSDVNIIATINPETGKIFLVTIPRDSWVKVYYGDGTDSGSQKDKLTHTGNNGIACTLSTVENLYDLDIDYYVRLNFTGFEKLVDALGGIDVESDYAFTSYAQTHTYKKGINHLDGYGALIFARERHAFSDGDFQRAKNQTKVIQAILDKALSVTMLTNYTGIMDSLSDVVSTNVPSDQMTKLVKMQLSTMKKWSIQSYTVTGVTGSEWCMSYSGNPLSIVYVDEAQIDLVKAKIAAVEAGEDPDLITSVPSGNVQ